MNRTVLLCFTVVTLLVSPIFAQRQESADKTELYDAGPMESLFGEKLEKGSFEEGVWSFNEENILHANKDSVIWTNEKYGSFVCSFEFLASKGSDSGFFLHATDNDSWIPNTIEIQLSDDYGTASDYHSCGSFYGYQAPTENVLESENQWNKMTVVSLAQDIDVYLNGKHINHLNISQWTRNDKSPSGTCIEEKFQEKALSDSEPYGYIGLQGCHGGEGVSFRNLKIKRITCCVKEDMLEPLFGDNLEKAEFRKDTWSVDTNGIVKPVSDDAIFSKEKYDNYVYDLEFMNSQDSNSGIIIKCSNRENWIPNSLEIQVADSFGWPVDDSICGAVYGHCAPLFNVCKHAGEWNHIQVVCSGNLITVFLNDELITRMDKSQWTERDVNPDGSEVREWLRDHSPAELDDNGYLGLQGVHGESSVLYRNIRVGRLNSVE